MYLTTYCNSQKNFLNCKINPNYFLNVFKNLINYVFTALHLMFELINIWKI